MSSAPILGSFSYATRTIFRTVNLPSPVRSPLRSRREKNLALACATRRRTFSRHTLLYYDVRICASNLLRREFGADVKFPENGCGIIGDAG